MQQVIWLVAMLVALPEVWRLYKQGRAGSSVTRPKHSTRGLRWNCANAKLIVLCRSLSATKPNSKARPICTRE